MRGFPPGAAPLEALQRRLAAAADEAVCWRPVAGEPARVAAVFAAPFRGLVGLGTGADPAWAAAAVRALHAGADVLLVNATGRDHPRRAGVALHLGAVLAVPTVGVTDRPLAAEGAAPGPGRGDRSPLRLAGGEVVGFRLRVRAGARPLCVSAGWRTDPETAAGIVLAACGGERTPLPLREARRRAREARA